MSRSSCLWWDFWKKSDKECDNKYDGLLKKGGRYVGWIMAGIGIEGSVLYRSGCLGLFCGESDF